MNRYKFVLLHVWNICSKPDATLSYEALMSKFYNKKVLNHFIMPLAELLFIFAFVGTLISSDLNFASAIVKSIFSYFTFVVSYGALFFVIRWITLKFFSSETNERNLTLMVSSLMSVNFVVLSFQSLMPNLFFVSLFYIYLFYLVWLMSEGIIDIAEGQRNKYMALISIVVFIIPFIVGKLLILMIPNL